MADFLGKDDEIIQSNQSNFGSDDEVIGSQDEVLAPENTDSSWFEKGVKGVKDNFSNLIGSAGKAAFNPIGSAIEQGNKVPYLQDVIPDVAETISQPNNDIAAGIAGGLYGAARNTAQLGADIQDAALPGAATPMSDILSVVPKFEGENVTQDITANLTEIGSGLLS